MSLSFTHPNFIGSFLILAICGVQMPVCALGMEPSVVEITDVHEFFPDQAGNEWVYRGTMIEGGMVQIADKRTTFTNVSRVKGEEVRDGVKVTVFHDTNPGNQGPSDSYYRRDAAGIRYYGSKPGTTLEKQLVPYQIVRFPFRIPSSFEQLNRKGLDLGVDIDRDGQPEKVDVLAVVSVQGQGPVTVPAGTYPNAIQIEAKMVMTVYLSEKGETIKGTDTMTAWFGRGVGLVKYVERQVIPSLRSQTRRMIEVIEELEKVTLPSNVARLGRSKSSTEGIFCRNFLHHKLLQIPFSACLPSHS